LKEIGVVIGGDMKNRRFVIRVKRDGKIITTIQRTIYSKIIGNFNPFYCRYNNREYLVYSELGKISDPFRYDKEMLKTLYIEV